MLTFEDLFVANQTAKRHLQPIEPLRHLLGQLDAHPEHVQLIRYLHEHRGVALDQAMAIHEATQTYLRRRSEDRYATLLRQKAAVPVHVVEGLAMEQALAGYSWGLGEKLVQEQALTVDQHRSIQQETMRSLQQEEEHVLRENRDTRFTPILGPPLPSGVGAVSPSSEDARQSGQGRVPPGGRRTAAHLIPPPPPPPPSDGRGEGRSTKVHYVPVPPAPVPHEEMAGDSEKTVSLDASQLAANPAETLPWKPEDGEAEDARATLVPDSEAEQELADPGDAYKTMRMRADEVIPLPPSGPDPGATATLSADALPDLPPDADPFATMSFKPGETMTGRVGTGVPNVRMGGTSPVLKIGESIGGKYQVESELGRGAMGIVYEGYDPVEGKTVAIKVVQGPANEEVLGRFQREILVSQRATHDHVIHVFDAGELPDGSSFMVMEYLEGESLQGILLREGAQPYDRALLLLEQLLQGLAALHAKQIVHRDLKPENLQVVQQDGQDHIKIMDFGISRFLDEAAVEEKLFVTMRGQLSGTPQYVAPEAILDPEEVLPSHDIYACGVILYEMVTGTLPFPEARTLRDLLADTVNSRPRPLEESNPERAPYPEPIAKLVLKLLDKDPMSRPTEGSQALELLAETREELEHGPKAKAKAKGQSATARFFKKITGIFSRKKG